MIVKEHKRDKSKKKMKTPIKSSIGGHGKSIKGDHTQSIIEIEQITRNYKKYFLISVSTDDVSEDVVWVKTEDGVRVKTEEGVRVKTEDRMDETKRKYTSSSYGKYTLSKQMKLTFVTGCSRSKPSIPNHTIPDYFCYRLWWIKVDHT